MWLVFFFFFNLDITLNSTKIFLAFPKRDDPFGEGTAVKDPRLCRKEKLEVWIAVHVPLCKEKKIIEKNQYPNNISNRGKN